MSFNLVQLEITHWVVPFSFAVSTAIGTVSESELTESSAIAFLNQPWETLFIQAPSLISLLGQLTVMSGQVDFSLAVSPPVQGFRHVKFPNSFRATLSQVGHDAWNAFHAAHRNMDAIQLRMQMMPAKIHTVTRMFDQLSPALFG